MPLKVRPLENSAAHMAAATDVPVTVSIAIAGSGGTGAMTTGTMLLDAAGQAGWYGYMTRSSGAQIRGGEVAAMIRLSTHPVESHDDHYDVVLAIDWQNVDRFAAELALAGTSLLIGDPDTGEVPPALRAKRPREHAVRIGEIAGAIEGGRPNMVALGLIAGMIGLPQNALMRVLRKTLGKKGDAAVRASETAVERGLLLVKDAPAVPQLPAAAVAKRDSWSITGNEAAGLGAIAGGVRFVAAYPITPGTEILEWLAPALADVGGVLVQAEDELASINQIIGASYAGVPSLTATSGPGLSLMTESIGLAVAAEIPIVIVDVMRGGPSTGIPVKSEQSDLNIALHGLHGDAPHLVVAPTSVSDCLFATQWAVHLAEAMQSPCIVLSDQSLGQTRSVIPRPADVAFIAQRETAKPAKDAGYQRYAVTASGISPMALPGTPGGQYTADGLEHNPFGIPSSESANHAAQLDKRQRKIELFNYGTHWAEIEGEGQVAIITWGSSTGPSREAVSRLKVLGVDVRLVALRLLSPAQPDRLSAALAGVHRVLVVEQSHSRQFYRMLRAYYDLPDTRTYAQPGPLPIRPGAIVDMLLDWK
jgi:2-oxoglutarate ferredoxin oxidoreductase subunit alpha